ncbi:MAG TPA: amidohydrolase family protein [Bryobacteraceae bacterium]|nr:amidohydrolase family protein [Bryobacteraceae bacterium]
MLIKVSRLLNIFLMLAAAAYAQQQPVVIRAGTLLDGKGGVQRNADIVVQNGKIQKVGPANGKASYDLREATVLPGMIDTHVHIAWHFGPDGRYQPRDTSQTAAMGYAVENAYVTLMGGFTTVQSVGSPIDGDLRTAINRGVLPGPRVLTSLRAINNGTLTPEEIREAVRKMAADGSDVIKIFASKSIRDGGGATLTDEQIQAACGEAKAQHLRAIVHVYQPATIKAVVAAGCTAVEHGSLANLDALQFIAAHGTYFDPNIGLVAQNYLAHRVNFLGIGNYTEEGMAAMEKGIPQSLAVFKEALTVPGMKIVYGTDAVAGAHGHNVEELIYRVQKGGQDPKAAITSATSLSAESLGMGDKIGSLAPGMDADIIAVEGDPLKNVETMRHVIFVMKGGQVFKNSAR